MEPSDEHSTGVRPGRAGVWCIVVAGGSGQRFGAAKQFVELAGRSVLERSIEVAATAVEGVVVVLPAALLASPDGAGHVSRLKALDAVTAVVPGGDTRAGSVRAGLAAVPGSALVVLVHDAARPLASAQLFARVRDEVHHGAEAVVPVVAVTDTIRSLDGGVVDRDRLRAVQTPQGFSAETLRAVHEHEPEATDDAGLVERAGGTVHLVEGERRNLKLTEPDDLVVAEALLGAAVAPEHRSIDPASQGAAGTGAGIASGAHGGGDSTP